MKSIGRMFPFAIFLLAGGGAFVAVSGLVLYLLKTGYKLRQ